MRIDIISIFPEYFAPLDISLIGKARERGILDIRLHQLRDWTHDVHRTVDDTPYGGGPGMVMKPEPWGEAIDAVIGDAPAPPHLIVPTPSGRLFTQERAVELAGEPWIDADCGSTGPCANLVRNACAGAGFAPKVAVESDDYATAQGFVAAGLGVTIIPRLGLGYAHPGVVLRKVRNPEPVRHIHVVYREDAAWNPAVVALAEALEKAARTS